jgi:ribosomal protein L11 methyltransferase
MLVLNIQPGHDSDVEILSALFNQFDLDGVELLEHSLLVYVKEEIYQLPDFNTAMLEWQSFQPFQFTVETLPEINWNKEWESHFDPVFVEDFLTIKADFHQVESNAQLTITINPKMSFGTGHHATTWMMTKAMSLINHENKKVLDAGAGTAILAILAAKLGANQVIAFDNDPLCYTNALENVEINQTNQIEVLDGTLDTIQAFDFDIILANINRNFLLSHGEEFIKRMKKDSFLILSGFFFTECQLILDYYLQFGLVAQFLQHRDEWACIVLKRGMLPEKQV